MTVVIAVVALTPAQSIPAGAAGAEEEFPLSCWFTPWALP